MDRLQSALLPRCLRHYAPAETIEQARDLAAFLRNALVDCWREGSDMGEQEQHGFLLCFDLLRDKLDMAAGKLPFPLAGILPAGDGHA
ncbi:MAG: hypothetical protein MSH25_10280 [Desulfovibrio sp.]|uniref:hypothetical protein n=1 Tax=Desulfovibrio sp. TaxID=885 RepID=UPI0025BDB321|nr:hypothetical protein [Desulfovibrio sp.]MCI7569726.1 hypothetical protein [Desulfovibrio sp.]